MNQFSSIVCQSATTQEVIRDCLAQLEQCDSNYNFAFIYATDHFSTVLPDLLKQCKQVTGINYWVGSLGVGIIATRQELYDQPAVSIMLAQFDEQEFTVSPLLKSEAEIKTIHWPHSFFTSFGIIHGDPSHQQTQTIIDALSKQVEDCFLVGGLTSSQHKPLQIANESLSAGVSGVFFSEQIPVLTNLTQGCSPIGPKRTITQSKDNLIYLLDDQPALNVLMQDYQFKDIDDLKQKAGSVFTGLCIPHSDQSDYTIRNLVGADFDKNVIAINDYAREGDEMMFCTRNEQTAVDDMLQMLEKINTRLDKPPKGGLYVSCLGRGREQFGHHSEEINMIHDVLGDFPLTGFFANGEIHHNKLYGFTGVLTLFV
jgi:small ligand-binding sensory domain FIST